MKNWTISDFAFVLFLTGAVILMGFFIYRTVQQFDRISHRIHVCQTSGYAGRIQINYNDYCYRLEGDEGQLILASRLEGKNDKR